MALCAVLWGFYSIGLVGCGYVSQSSYLSHIRTIRIPPVQNQTVLFELGDEMTAELKRRFNGKWTDGDDSLLLVTVHQYEIRPVAYDVNNLPEQYRMQVILDYELQDKIKGKLVDAKRDYEFHHDFYVVSGRGEDPEDESTARKRLLEELVDQLYYKLAEQW